MGDILPKVKGMLYIWLTSFKNSMPSFATTLGIPATEIAATLAMIDAKQAAEDNAVSLRDKAKAATEKAHVQSKVTEANVRAMIRRIKNTPGYTKDMGKAMGIIASAQTLTKAQEKPVLRPRVTGGYLEVRFSKFGHDAMNIYSMRSDDTEYTLLGTIMMSPYRDQRPNLIPGKPEMRMYKAFFVDKDVQQGEESAMESIIV